MCLKCVQIKRINFRNRIDKMCGIAWFLLQGLTEEQIQQIKEQANRISHRGPDATNSEVVKNELWAFHRLAIINVAPKGIQPFTSSNSSRLICNGEIYNYQTLMDPVKARSDCDAVLHILDKTIDNFSVKGVCEAVDQLDGDFAFVWKHGNNMVIGRDHVGVCPLFYAIDESDKLIAVASECKALLNTPNMKTIKVFPPGHVWINGELHPYHSTELPLPITSTKEEATKRVQELIIDAVRKRIDHSDRPVGVLCSGGIDSSIVTCLVKELGLQDRIHVFTMEYKGARSEDAFYASMLCQKMGLKHTMFSFTKEDVQQTLQKIPRIIETYDPNTIRAAIPMYLLAHKIATTTDVRVILSGEGADELFHGYNYFRRAPDGETARVEAKRLVQNLHMFDLLRAERCFSSAGLEVRVPFLDQNLVRYVQSLEGTLPWGGQGYAEKQLLRDAFAYISYLTELRILDRPKERFSDGCGFTYVPQLLSYISNDLPTLAEKLVVEKQYVEQIFDTTYPNLRDLIINRTMPEWVEETKSDNLLVM